MMAGSKVSKKGREATGESNHVGRFGYQVFRYSLLWIWTLGYWIRYTGRHNIPPTGPVLVVSNHQSHFDPPLVGAGIPRQMKYVARRTLFTAPGFGRLIKWLGAIPIDREGGVMGIRETLRRLKQGEMILIFPEGTRSPDGRIGPFRPGFSALAFRARATVLPVAIEGAYQAWPRSRKLPRLGVIHVHYCEPIFPDQLTRFDDRTLIEEVRRRIVEAHDALRRRPALIREARRIRRETS